MTLFLFIYVFIEHILAQSRLSGTASAYLTDVRKHPKNESAYMNKLSHWFCMKQTCMKHRDDNKPQP